MDNNIKLEWFEFKQMLDSGTAFKYVTDSKDNYKLYALNGTMIFTCEIPKDPAESRNSDQIDFEDNYSSNALANLSSAVEVKERAPFAKPDYRTKMNATSAWQNFDHTITDSKKVIDFELTAERYVTGGEILFKNSKEGDYITAEVHDVNGVIPEAYRAALCEAHPTVAQYVEKRWLVPTEVDKYGKLAIDTYPLNAKISAGLFLRITYHVNASETGTRKCAVNYNLTKKL